MNAVTSPVIASGDAVQSRINTEIAKGKPIVIHIIVALCDNKYQGIVPVPKSIGNGQDPNTNLYWGAGFGLRSFFRKYNWITVKTDHQPTRQILERIIFNKKIRRNSQFANVFVIAEAWDGKEIRTAIYHFLDIAAGNKPELFRFDYAGTNFSIDGGGASHLVAYVGHDGLMDFSLPINPAPNTNSAARSSIVLACASLQFFGPRLTPGQSHQLLLTRGLMAPEAYTLEAAISSWLDGKSSQETLNSAASAYNQFQKCGIHAAKHLFYTTP